MNFTLSITPDQYTEEIIKTEGFLETLGFGAQMLILGMGTVFSVLALLWLSLTLFKIVFHGRDKKEEKVEQNDVSATVEPVYNYSDDSEIVAVIAAAIAMAESDNEGLKFRVVSFKRK